MSILVVGSIVLDYIHSPYGRSEGALGGSAIYFAGASSLYAPVRLVGVVGEDFPDSGRRFLTDRNIDVEGMTTLPGHTFRYEAEYGSDMQDRKTISTCLNVFDDFHPELPPSYRETPLVFLGNIDPALQIEVLDQVVDPKHIAADTMNFWIEGARENLLQMLARIDTLFLNDSEAQELSGESNLITATKAVAELGPDTVVVKKGEHGAMLYRNGKFFSVPAYPLESVKDPTGAGDAFAGGFLGHVARAGDLRDTTFREAMLHGAASASFVVEEFGPDRLEGVTEEDVNARVDVIRGMMSTGS